MDSQNGDQQTFMQLNPLQQELQRLQQSTQLQQSTNNMAMFQQFGLIQPARSQRPMPQMQQPMEIQLIQQQQQQQFSVPSSQPTQLYQQHPMIQHQLPSNGYGNSADCLNPTFQGTADSSTGISRPPPPYMAKNTAYGNYVINIFSILNTLLLLRYLQII